MKGRGFVFAAVLLAGVVGFLEVSSLLLMRFAGSGASLLELSRRRQEILASDPFSLAAAGTSRTGAFQNVLLHPFLGYVLDPSLDGVNAFGFWGEEGPFHDGPDDVIVAITGGSVAQQFRALSRDVLVEELRRIPRFRDARIHVVSLGVWAYKQPQQLAAVSYLLALGARFDVVINIDGFNEVGNALNNLAYRKEGVFPAYPSPIPWNALTASLASPGHLQLAGETRLLRQRRHRLARFFQRLRFSATASFAWELLDGLLANRLQELQWTARSLGDGDDPSLAYVRGGPRGRVKPREVRGFSAELWKNASLQIHHLARGGGFAYFHFLQPNQYVPDSKPLAPEELRNAYQAEGLHRRHVVAGYPHLLAAGQELRDRGVEFVDLTRVFEDVEEPLYVDTCCHLNKAGNDILARKIGQVLAGAFRGEALDPGSPDADGSPSLRCSGRPLRGARGPLVRAC